MLVYKQSCGSRRQTNSMSSRPRFCEIWKVSRRYRDRYRDRYRCLGKKVSPWSRPRSSFSRPPHAENETSIAVRGSRLPPPTPRPFLYNCGPSTVSSTVYSMQYSIQYAVQYTVYSIQNNNLCQQLFTKFTLKRKAEINKFYILTYFNSLVDRWIWKYTKLWYG